MEKENLVDAVMERRRLDQGEKMKAKGVATTSLLDTLFRKRRERETQLDAIKQAEE